MVAHLKETISKLEGENLQLASMFLFNWTEGPWTPAPLTPEQVAEIKKRADDLKSGKTKAISSEEVFKELEEKYGFVREKGAEYEAKREKEERARLLKMIGHISREHLIQFDVFLESYRQKSTWKSLSVEGQESILRGMEDSKKGNLTDAFEYLKTNG